MERIVMYPIGVIHSPYRENTDIPIQGIFKNKMEANRMYFTEVDMLDATPVLDIKPYVKYFDSRNDVRCGWLDKHFKNGDIPSTATSKRHQK